MYPLILNPQRKYRCNTMTKPPPNWWSQSTEAQAAAQMQAVRERLALSEMRSANVSTGQLVDYTASLQGNPLAGGRRGELLDKNGNFIKPVQFKYRGSGTRIGKYARGFISAARYVNAFGDAFQALSPLNKILGTISGVFNSYQWTDGFKCPTMSEYNFITAGWSTNNCGTTYPISTDFLWDGSPKTSLSYWKILYDKPTGSPTWYQGYHVRTLDYKDVPGVPWRPPTITVPYIGVSTGIGDFNPSPVKYRNRGLRPDTSFYPYGRNATNGFPLYSGMPQPQSQPYAGRHFGTNSSGNGQQPPTEWQVTDRYRQPSNNPREKERKGGASAKTISVMFGALEGFTEANDLVDSFYKALPKRRQYAWNVGGKYILLYRYWHEVNLDDALRNILYNHLEDRVIGTIERSVKRTAGRGAFSGLTGSLGGTMPSGDALGAFAGNLKNNFYDGYSWSAKMLKKGL